MEKNLFQKAKDMMTKDEGNHGQQSERNEAAIRQAIQDAYHQATPEEQAQLKQFEQQLDENMNLQ